MYVIMTGSWRVVERGSERGWCTATIGAPRECLSGIPISSGWVNTDNRFPIDLPYAIDSDPAGPARDPNPRDQAGIGGSAYNLPTDHHHPILTQAIIRDG